MIGWLTASPTNIIVTVMGVLLAVSIGLFTLYYYTSQDTIAELNKTLGVQKTALAVQEQTINSMKEQVASITESTKKNQEEVASIRNDTSKLSKLLAKHNLATLAANKPVLIENRINSSTKQILKELEDISKEK